jgi:glucosylceramidase
VLGHAAKFVAPGAQRIGSSSYAGDIETVAFRNPDGSIALITLNAATASRTFKVRSAGQSYTYTLPAGAVATFTWRPGAAPSPTGGTTSGPTSSPPASPTAAPTTPPTTPGIVKENVYYRLAARHSGKALDVRDSSTANGASIQQWDYAGGINQQWRFVGVGGGYYRILARGSGKALDVRDVSTANGTLIQQWDYTGGANQQWQVVDVGGGNVRIVARHSGKALDVQALSTANGALVQQWDYTGGANQQWTLTELAPVL